MERGLGIHRVLLAVPLMALMILLFVAGTAGAEEQYKVQPGDTLGKISEKFYGSPGKWKLILEANRDRIPDPNALKVGQVLIIPGVEPAAAPIGVPRTDRDLRRDVNALLYDRRVSVSDLPGGLAFKPKDCMRCHENDPDVEGQIFYGYPDFEKDVDWPGYIGDADKKHAPSLKYDFYETHRRKSKLTRGGNAEQFLKQNQ